MYQIFRSKDQTPTMGIKGVRLISYSSQTRSGTSFFLLRLLDSLMIGNILTKFEKIYIADFFQWNDLAEGGT